jgi:hypothetical protein
MEIYHSIYNYQGYEVIKFESPDFIVWKKNVEKLGLEATTPSNKEQNELKNIANSESREKLGRKYRYEKYRREGKIYSNGVEIQSSESRVIQNILLNGIEPKFFKLNKNYTLFDKNILSFTPISTSLYNQDDHIYLIDCLNRFKSKYKSIFDEIVLITYDKVVRYSLNGDRDYFLESVRDLSAEHINEIIKLIHL